MNTLTVGCSAARAYSRRLCGGRSTQHTLKTLVTLATSSPPIKETCNRWTGQICRRSIYRLMQNDSKGNTKSSGAASSTFRERLGELRKNGTPEIVIGSLILAVVGIDYALQTQNDEEKDNLYRQLQRDVKNDGEQSRQNMIQSGSDVTKSLFQCIVRRIPPNFDGHKCLTDIKIGDVVNVIEEGVGPGKQYNLCSIDKSVRQNNSGDKGQENDTKNEVSVGWFPCSCLQKVE